MKLGVSEGWGGWGGGEAPKVLFERYPQGKATLAQPPTHISFTSLTTSK